MKIAKMDVGSNNAIATQYGVMHIPTLILFVGGEPVERLVGAMSKANLLSKLEPYLA